MEKRYQVFISSTFQDLQNARQEVSQALLRADCFPAGMELFPAADEEQFEFIKTIIDQSDYYILISAGRYGSIHPETGLSYTEMEYDYAVETGKPIMRLLHKDPFNDLKGGAIERSDLGRKRLAAFRKKLTSSSLVAFWENEQELGMQATLGLLNAIKRYESSGWVKLDRKVTARINSSTKGVLGPDEIESKVRKEVIQLTDVQVAKIDEVENVILSLAPTIEIKATAKYLGFTFLDEIISRTLYGQSTGVKIAIRMIAVARAPVEKEILLQTINREFFGRYAGRFANILMGAETNSVFDAIVLPLINAGVLERKVEVSGDIDSGLQARELFVISEATYLWLQKKLDEGPNEKSLTLKTPPPSAP